MSGPVRVFISYARKDLKHLEALETHLSNLRRQKRIIVWTDQQLRPSIEWEPELLDQLRSAEIVLLLVTPDLMASDFVHDVELKETLDRHRDNTVKVVPVLVRPTDYEGHELARFQGLPRNFTPVSEWQSRDQAWLEVVKGVRELVERLRPSSPPPTVQIPPPPKPPLIPEAWRRELLRRFEHLDLNADGKLVRPRLDELYVALKTDWLSPQELEKQQRARQFSPKFHRHSLSRPLSSLLEHPEYAHFVLRGGPGSGKSTFLRMSSLEQVRSGKRLPVLLELKDFAAWLSDSNAKGDSAELLPTWAGQMLADFDLREAGLYARLGYGETLWMLDGLDEIFDQAQRLRVARILNLFVHGALGRHERVVITSRPYALDDAHLVAALGLQSTTARILDLDPDGQRELLDHWLRTTYTPEKQVHVQADAARMLAHLNEHADLIELRRNPLVLTTLANMYFAHCELPTRRAELLERVVWLLLNRRFGPGLPEGSVEKVTRVRRALAYVARQMMQIGAVRELGDLEFRRLLEAGWCSEDPEPTRRALSVERLAVELGCNTGLLLMEGQPSVYRFSHLSVQEYLAAWSIGQESSPFEAVESRLDEGTWRETILLIAGYLGIAGGERLTGKFLEALLKGRGTGEVLCRRLELALQAAVEAPRGVLLASELKQRVTLAVEALEDKQSRSPISDRVALGLALARLGDPRLGLTRPENWAWIWPGEFMMGDDESEFFWVKPAHRVKVPRGFHMYLSPVTNHDFQAFVDAGGYKDRQWWSMEGWIFNEKKRLDAPLFWQDPHWNAKNQPVVGISWWEADAFCRWMTEYVRSTTSEAKESFTIRLPTEAEWEYAACGQTRRTYPWGSDEPTPERANYHDTGLARTSPVGTFPMGATPDGLLDMAGNVWEWVVDYYQRDYVGATHDGESRQGGSDQPRIVRGGGWYSLAINLSSAYRDWHSPVVRTPYIGFRIVRVSSVNGIP